MATKIETPENADKLRADVEALRHDLAEVTKTLKGMANGAGATVAHNAAERVREVSDQAREQFDQARDYAVDHVRERPLITVAATFGIGLLIGRLMK
ncbi:YqjD family protein [Thalassospira sp.]|uniref:DUF883 family protein n=1 Tax=Thalassospira sp. TaxID=1912094 RepID=UPI002734AE8E|nr:hypothetical protein [Thalassospira sp.]MDP2697646.1 hypothetical protein [Thalassospira sp.]